jgi:hypothetical protein
MSVFEIISYASRAFAFYYAIQALIAAKGSWSEKRSSYQCLGFSGLALLGLSIAIFGTSAE